MSSMLMPGSGSVNSLLNAAMTMSAEEAVIIDDGPQANVVGESTDFEEDGNEQDDELPKKGKKRVKSRFKGVFKCGKKFKAQIQTHGVQHYLGLFDSEEDAARAYDAHARTVLGLKAKTNYDDYDARSVPEGYEPADEPAEARPEDNRSAHALQTRRSYMGIKVRRKARSAPSGPMPLPAAGGGGGAIQLAPQMSPSRFLLSNLSRAVLTAPQGAAAKAAPTAGTGSTPADWSKHPYTPLEISAPSPFPLQPLSEPDWRDQIYYWTGTLLFDNEEHRMVWSGRWLGSFTGRPLPEEFANSRNAFLYTSSAQLPTGTTKPVSGCFQGHYLIDAEGSGELERFDEQDVQLDFDDSGRGPWKVYGKGDGEFGVFILDGTYDASNHVLEVTRQYLAESDARCAMTVPQLAHYFKRKANQQQASR